MSFFSELKRRNVLRVGAAYVVAAWLLIQVAETIFPLFGFDGGPARIVVIVLAIGFLPTLIFAWVFELTPQGLQKESDIDRTRSITSQRGKKLDRMIMLVLALALGYFALDKFVLDPARDKMQVESATERAVQEALANASQSAVLAPSIAVLPFVDMSPNQDQEYFSDGLAESLLHLLARIKELKVAARTSSFAFKNKNAPVSDIGEVLNVAYVLEGSVRKSGDQVRITTQLIETDKGYHLWSKTYDRAMGDIFAIQDEIAEEVVKSLKLTMLRDVPTTRETDPDAYALFLQARYLHRQFKRDSSEQALKLYRQVLAIDPEYAPAWTNMSSVYSNLAKLDPRPPDEAYELAREAAETAILIDQNLSSAYDQLGWLAFHHDADFAKAIRYYEKALTLYTNNYGMIGNAGTLAQAIGRIDEAIELMEYHVKRQADSAIAHNNLAIAYWYAHRFEDSERSIRTALRLSPDYWGGQYRLGKALLLKGELGNALVAFESESTDEEFRVKGLALAYHALGRRAEADAALADLTERWGETWPSEVAQVHAYRGHLDAAFRWLDKKDDKSGVRWVDWRFDPLYRNLQEDPRWQALLENSSATDRHLAKLKLNFELP